jgi:hypothetical protein
MVRMWGALLTILFAFVAWCLIKPRDNLASTMPLKTRNNRNTLKTSSGVCDGWAMVCFYVYLKSILIAAICVSK